MRLLAATDLHAEEEAATRLKKKLAAGGFDGIILLGDITHNGPISFAEDFISDLSGLGVKIYAVMGNMDPPEVREALEGAGASIHLRKEKLGNGWSIAGFGGSPARGSETPTEFSEEEIYSGLNSLGINQKTILATHAPASGIGGFDLTRSGIPIGSESLRRIIEESKPAVVLSGHVHEQEGIAQFKQTLVVKVAPASWGRAAILDLGQKIKAELVDI